jgi:hypothetical protein
MEGNPVVLVENIEITSEGGMNTISTDGGILQLTATILPENATNKNTTWSVVSGEEFGFVSENGLFSATNNGIAVVQASANDGSGIYNTFSITISNQKTSVADLAKSGIKVTRDIVKASYIVHFNNESSTTRLMIYSISGELVWSEKSTATFYNIPKQKPGVYILKLQQGDQRCTEKLVF